MLVYFQGRMSPDKKNKIITAINLTGASGPDFWYFPTNHRNLKYHPQRVQDLITEKNYSTIVHLSIELSEEEKNVYPIVNGNFRFRGAALEKNGKLSKQFSCK